MKDKSFDRLMHLLFAFLFLFAIFGMTMSIQQTRAANKACDKAEGYLIRTRGGLICLDPAAIRRTR